MSNPNRSFDCTHHCGQVFNSADDWQLHEMTNHVRQNEYRCTEMTDEGRECGKIFWALSDYLLHLMAKHDIGAVQRQYIHARFLPADYACRFWCGFCQQIIPNLPMDGYWAYYARFFHIGNHFLGVCCERVTIDQWVD